MEKVRRPRFRIVYEGRDITQDIEQYLTAVEYTDNTGTTSDEVSFTVEDTFGMWRGAWFPFKGDKFTLEIGYDNNLLSCGTFTVDEIEMQGPPDTVSIKGLAAGINSPLRTKNSKAFEGQTLRQIADEIAKKYGFQIIDSATTSGVKPKSILDTIRVERITQNRETDLEFLKRVAGSYGVTFSLRDDKLIFVSTLEVENGKVVSTLSRTELISYSLKETATKVYKKAVVKHHDKKKNKVTKAEIQAGAQQAEANSLRINSEHANAQDTLVIYAKVDNLQQAEEKARAALHLANSKHQEGSVVVDGNPLLVAGNNFDLTEMGSLSGKFCILKSSHRIGRDGYTTDLEIKRIGDITSVGKTFELGEVLFDTDSSTIRSEGFADLEAVLAYMVGNPGVVMEVAGHTDSVASAEYNIGLSTRRANSVRDYMISKGILATRLVAKGYGESKPRASNATPEGRQKNRRTVFTVIANKS